MPASQRTVQVCLFLVTAIALFGGTVQMVMGQPDTTPRLDNLHRFMAGVYLSMGFISLWAALTIRQQGTLIYLIALAVLLAAVGRLVSMSQVGLPQPATVWLLYLGSELVLPLVMVMAHRARPAAVARTAHA
jgi:predicted membrane channel-forming protein YqfA (hemolysin III family)